MSWDWQAGGMGIGGDAAAAAAVAEGEGEDTMLQQDSGESPELDDRESIDVGADTKLPLLQHPRREAHAEATQAEMLTGLSPLQQASLLLPPHSDVSVRTPQPK